MIIIIIIACILFIYLGCFYVKGEEEGTGVCHELEGACINYDSSICGSAPGLRFLYILHIILDIYYFRLFIILDIYY
jgi:hypothetical protein